MGGKTALGPGSSWTPAWNRRWEGARWGLLDPHLLSGIPGPGPVWEVLFRLGTWAPLAKKQDRGPESPQPRRREELVRAPSVHPLCYGLPSPSTWLPGCEDLQPWGSVWVLGYL